MKILLFLSAFFLLCSTNLNAQEIFELDPSQSMLMTGKGQGQDATINPFAGQDSFAVVENLGKRAFSVRIQKQGEILKEINVAKGQTKKILLLKEQELYLDPNPKGKTKAKVSYEELVE
ncbi:MAG: hypothetical protein R3321_14470 [Nitrososphaeraceae archaeon]|nr:hypothetical protein [Nitrososphaeraceae archaeon]